MKTKKLNLLLILTSLIGYLEWGGGKSMFLFQMEADIFKKLFSDPTSVMHPFVVLPLLGQVLLLITLFQQVPHRIMTYLGIGTIGVLLGFMFVISIMAMGWKVCLSTLPFLLTAFITIRHFKKARLVNKSA